MSQLTLHEQNDSQNTKCSCPHLIRLLSPEFIQELEIAAQLVQESGEYELALSLTRWREKLTRALQTTEDECPMLTELWLG